MFFSWAIHSNSFGPHTKQKVDSWFQAKGWMILQTSLEKLSITKRKMTTYIAGYVSRRQHTRGLLDPWGIRALMQWRSQGLISMVVFSLIVMPTQSTFIHRRAIHMTTLEQCTLQPNFSTLVVTRASCSKSILQKLLIPWHGPCLTCWGTWGSLDIYWSCWIEIH
jgi:hypothetical protein